MLNCSSLLPLAVLQGEGREATEKKEIDKEPQDTAETLGSPCLSQGLLDPGLSNPVYLCLLLRQLKLDSYLLKLV
jgi:hypothetical protein